MRPKAIKVKVLNGADICPDELYENSKKIN